MHLALLQNESSNPQKIMLNMQLFQYFGLWAKNSNKTSNDAERGEYVLFKLDMLVILVCYCETGIIQLKAKIWKLMLRLNFNLSVVSLD